jgi:hypothetical protein
MPRHDGNKKEDDVIEAMTRLADPTELLPKDARRIIILYRKLLKNHVKNPGDQEDFDLYKKLNRVIALYMNRDDGVLRPFLEKMLSVRNPRTEEEQVRYNKEVESLNDDDVPSADQVLIRRNQDKEDQRQQRIKDEALRERLARGEPLDPKEIPVSLESMVGQMVDPGIPPRTVGGR